MIPIDLILVRHGQSEGNLAIHKTRHGDDSLLTEKFLRCHSSKWRLTNLGIFQAQSAGEWLKKNKLESFCRYYVSDLIRAKETAAEMNFSDARWYVDSALSEREYGEIDPVSGCYRKDSFTYTEETIYSLFARVHQFLETLYREFDGKKVIIVSHGEIISVIRFYLEQSNLQEWLKFKTTNDPKVRINNGQILHYTRQDPQNGAIQPNLSWVKYVYPDHPNLPETEFSFIPNQMTGPQFSLSSPKQTTFTNQELLAEVNQYPHIFE